MTPVLVVNSFDDLPTEHPIVEFMLLPHKHIGEARQAILENFKGKVVVIDDDVVFHEHQGDGKFARCGSPDILRLFAHINNLLDHYAHVGVCERFMAHARTRPLEHNKRYIKLTAYNTDLFPNPWPQYRVPISEDTDFNLQLLSAGRRSAIITEWATSDLGQYKPGGCQRYRTDEMEKQVCEQMMDLWPGICSYYVSKDGRYRMRVRWSKMAC